MSLPIPTRPASFPLARREVSCGYETKLVLMRDGTVVAWGGNDYGQSNVPVELSGVVSVAAGPFFCIALKSDGTVVAWGRDSGSNYAFYHGLSNVVAISAGGAHVGVPLALKSDGTVVSQAGVIAWLSTDNVAISVGTGHSLALKSDGTVVAWGDNTYGQTAVPVGLSGVVSVSAGAYHSLALKSDGTVVAWGENRYGQSNVPAGLSGVVSVAAGGDLVFIAIGASFALKSDGTVVAWGRDIGGDVPSLSGVVAIDAGGTSLLALKSDVTVSCIGYNAPIPETLTLSFGNQTISGAIGSLLYRSPSVSHGVAVWSQTGKPSWASFNTTNGVFSGTPDARGNTVVSVTATDYEGLSATASVTIEIGYGTPIITAGQSITGKVGVAITGGPPTLTDSTNRPVTSWSATGLPSGVSCSSAGVLSGTPTAHGTTTAYFTATGPGGSSTTAVSFVIGYGAPIFSLGVQATYFYGGLWFISGLGGSNEAEHPITSMSVTGQPDWLTLNWNQNGARTISGTSNERGSWTFTLTATGPGGSTSASGTITIGYGIPSITTGQSFTGKVGVAITGTLSTDDPTNCPATSWLGLAGGITSTSGVLSGSPTTAGSYTTQAIASALVYGGNATPNYRVYSPAVSVGWTIAIGTPLIAANRTLTGIEGDYFNKSAELVDPTNRPVVLWEAADLPSWATINADTGMITGTPTAPAVTTVTITVTNALDESSSQTVRIAISARVVIPPPSTGTGSWLAARDAAKSGVGNTRVRRAVWPTTKKLVYLSGVGSTRAVACIINSAVTPATITPVKNTEFGQSEFLANDWQIEQMDF